MSTPEAPRAVDVPAPASGVPTATVALSPDDRCTTCGHKRRKHATRRDGSGGCVKQKWERFYDATPVRVTCSCRIFRGPEHRKGVWMTDPVPTATEEVYVHRQARAIRNQGAR